VCFAKHNLGWLGLKPRPSPLFFLGLGRAQPTRPSWPNLVTSPSQWPGWAAGTREATHACPAQCEGNWLPPHCFAHLNERTEQSKRKTLPGESEDEDGDEDQNDGLVRRMFFFPPLLSVSSHSALVFFFCNGFSFVFRFFYFFSPLFSPPFLHPSISYPSFFSAVFLPVFCFFFSLFFLANRWPFIGAEPTGCSPVCLFFS